MTSRTALRILSDPDATEECDEAQAELARAEAAAVLADALGFTEEAETARLVMSTLIAKDKHQMRFFELLDGGDQQ